MATMSVLIAVDESKEARDAFTFYMKKLHRPDNKLTLVHSRRLPIPRVTGEATLSLSFSSLQGAFDDIREEMKILEKEYTKYLHQHGVENAVLDFALGSCWPSQVILQKSLEINATLIVVGSRGLGEYSTILGSVSDDVFNNAHCPVLIYRKPKEPEEIEVDTKKE